MNLKVEEDRYRPFTYVVIDKDTNEIKTSGSKEICEKWLNKHINKYVVNRHRRKLYFYDIKDWGYHSFKNITRTDKNTNIKTKGILYYFDKLDDDKINYVLQYKNTEVLNISKTYAPEIHYKGVAIYDKCIR